MLALSKGHRMLTNRARLQENFFNRLFNSDLEGLKLNTIQAQEKGGFSLWAWIRKQWAAIVKFLQVSILLLIPLFAYSQEAEKRDTLNGIALIYEQLNVVTDQGIKPMYNTVTIAAYSVTRYILIVDGTGNQSPKILGVGYYRQEDCSEIQPRQIFAFKH